MTDLSAQRRVRTSERRNIRVQCRGVTGRRRAVAVAAEPATDGGGAVRWRRRFPGRTRVSYGATLPGADRLAWYFLRLSGVALVVLALGHLFITHYLNVPS